MVPSTSLGIPACRGVTILRDLVNPPLTPSPKFCPVQHFRPFLSIGPELQTHIQYVKMYLVSC